MLTRAFTKTTLKIIINHFQNLFFRHSAQFCSESFQKDNQQDIPKTNDKKRNHRSTCNHILCIRHKDNQLSNQIHNSSIFRSFSKPLFKMIVFILQILYNRLFYSIPQIIFCKFGEHLSVLLVKLSNRC